MMPSNENTKSTGFTLTEILAVMTIVSLLATLAAPSFQGYLRHLQLRTCLRQASQLFRQAQIRTRETYCPHRIILQQNRLTLQIKEPEGWTNSELHHQPAKSIVLSINQHPVFYPSGAIVPLCTLTLVQGSKQFTLTISAAGRIRIQNQTQN